MPSYGSTCGTALLWLSAITSTSPSIAAEPTTSSMACRLHLRVRELPPKDPVLMLRRLASINSDVVIGLSAGAVLEPLGPRDGNWQAVRWNGTHSGFVNARFTEDVVQCVPSIDRQPRLDAGVSRRALHPAADALRHRSALVAHAN